MKIIAEKARIDDIADAVRRKLNVETQYKLSEIPPAIDSIYAGGELVPLSVTANGDYIPPTGTDGFGSVHVAVPSATLTTKSITQNGTYNASQDNADGYSSVTVNVSGGYPEPTGTIKITQNGTVNVKDYASAEVNVSGGGSAIVQPLSVTQNGTYTPPSGVDGYAPVTVNVSGGGAILTGTDAPSASLGNDGDIYKRTFPIPSNVNFVEYLRGTGSQYIDTGIYVTNETDVDCQFIHSSTDDAVFGARAGGYNGYSNSLFLNDASSSAELRKGTASGANNKYIYGISLSTNEIARARTYTLKNGNLYTYISKINGKTGFLSEQTTVLSAVNEIRLFGYGGGDARIGPATIMRAIFYESGSPIADYLPCLDGNGIACMWDNIAEEYVYNDGTGDFAYGNTITPTPLDDVYYLKVNGSWEVIQQ